MPDPLTMPLLMPAIRLDRDAEGEAARALERAEHPWVGGYCLFGGHAEQVAALTAALRRRADRPLRIASDMERGAGQQVQGLPDSPDFGVLGLVATPRQVEEIARATARDARSVGVDVIFSPVLDVRSEPANPIVGTRSFGWDMEQVGLLGAAQVRGLHAGGTLAVAKHYPGHGATREDSHDVLPTVTADAQAFELRDLVPFRAVLEAGCRGVMTGHINALGLDPAGIAATFSRPILDRLRSWEGGEETLVFTDALLMAGALGAGSVAEAARRALLAGCDALLYPEEPERVAAEFYDVAASERTALQDAAARATLRWELAPTPDEDPVHHDAADRDTFALTLEISRLALLRGGVRSMDPARDLLIVDDDAAPGCGAVLAAAADAAGVPWVRFCPADELPLPDAPESGAVVVVFARARAWKGAAGISDAGLSAARRWQDAGATVIWCAPVRGGPGPLIPGGGTALETALAEALFRA